MNEEQFNKDLRRILEEHVSSPSMGFKNKLMTRIKTRPVSIFKGKRFVYLYAGFVVVIALLAKLTLPSGQFNIPTDMQWLNIATEQDLPNVLLYALLSFWVLLMVQISLLSRRSNHSNLQ